jgi:DNA-binding transcriptional LysR family regulator
MHNVNWSDLQIFLAVARAGRISAAARRLDVEHTTVARRLTTLESALGVPLFYRTRSGYLLTPHGHSVVPQAEAMERAAIAAAGRAREASSTIAGRVRVAMPPEFASHWLAPRLVAFREANPQLELQILVGTRQRDLSRGEADLAVHAAQPRQTGMITVKLARLAVGLYAARALVENRRIRIEDADSMRGLSLVAYTSQFQILQKAKWFQPILASAAIALTSNSTDAILAAGRAGLGVAVLPRFVARSYVDLVSVSENVAEHDVLLIAHPELRRDPRIQATADFLKRVARERNGLNE